ncbi:ABC transporter substrate-binding protein [Bacillus sp. 03113]|uniref:ABC transporter substrate-binding protein n=1 Tax=Bacillus sp. 03113 TaxID=2578211 RepID=UPI0011442543|nr:ABC transporter substrate-binding protein [Bacillus sp. 03113]
MKRSLWMSILLMLILMISACGKASEPASTEDEKETKETEANISGTIQFYTSQPDTDVTELVNGFNAKYPDVEVKVFRSGTEEVIGKLLAEKQAGSIQADVLLVADSVTFENLKEQDLLMPYESKELSEIPSEFVDNEHMYTGTKVMATVLAVNTEKVKELPSSWNTLTEASSKDKSIMPSPLYSGAAAYNVGVISRQSDFGWDFYQKLRDNNITVVQGNGAALKAVASGEKEFGMVVDFIVARSKKEGSPIDLVYPKEGVPVITEPIGIMKNTKNEAASKAFVDFVLSEEGQALANKLGYTPIRKGMDAPEGLKTIDELNVLSSPIDELLKTREDDKMRFKELLGE